jgi:hypothetical protein
MGQQTILQEFNSRDIEAKVLEENESRRRLLVAWTLY